MRRMQSTKALERTCAAFNERNPIGSSVRVWSGAREGEGRIAQTTEAAYVLGGHTAVVHVTGGRGCIALSHVEPESRP